MVETEVTEQETQEQEDDTDKPYFQAIGVVRGRVEFIPESTKGTITFRGKTFPLYFSKLQLIRALKLHIRKKLDNEVRLIVYPQFVHFPNRDKPYFTAFKAVGFSGIEGKSPELGLNDFEFKLCGLWQFIPVCQTPCVSIFKNFDKVRWTITKTRTAPQRVRFMKSQHIPLIWRDSAVKPFRFNPKLEKEEQAKRYFVVVKAKFLPEREVFGFDSLLAMPSEEIPNHFKASKKLKAEALIAKKEFLASKSQKPKKKGEQTENEPKSTEPTKPIVKLKKKPENLVEVDSIR